MSDTTFLFALPLDPGSLQGRPAGLVQDTVRFVRLDQTGEIVEAVAQLPAPPVHFFNQGAMWGLEREIFGASLLWNMVADRLVTVPGADPVLVLHGPGGALPVTLEVMTRGATAEMIAIERQRRIEAVRPIVVDGVDVSEERRDVIAGMPAATRVPAFEEVVGGQNESIWLKRFALESDSSGTWLVTDGATLQGRLQLPADQTLMAGTMRIVVTVATDELGAALVRLHRLSD